MKLAYFPVDELVHDSFSKILNWIVKVKVITVPSAMSMNSINGGKDRFSSAYYCHGGKSHCLPQGWIFPQMILHPVIVMWLVGIMSIGMPHLRTLAASDIVHFWKRV